MDANLVPGPPAPGTAVAAPGAVPSAVIGGPAGPAPSPAGQVVAVLAPLHTSTGTHQISLRLQPEGLGTVDATVVVHRGQVVVQLSADSPAAHQALSSSLPDLRNQLGAGGQMATVFLSDPGSGRGGARHQPGPAGAHTEPAGQPEPVSEAPLVVSSTRPVKSIDLRL